MSSPRIEVVDAFPGRVGWPCGHRPYGATVRAWHYRTRYWLPRVAMWLYVTVPPVAVTVWRLPLGYATGTRVAIECAVAAAALLVALFLDFSLYVPIFHGRGDSPGILDASRIAREWREAWLAFEARVGPPPSVTLSLYSPNTGSVPNFDNDDFTRGKERRAMFEKEICAGFERLKARVMLGTAVTEEYAALLIVWPLPEPIDGNATTWLLVHLLNNVEADSCRVTSGYTYWWSAGSVPGFGWYRGDEHSVKYTLPLAAFFSVATVPKVLLAAFAVAVWPLGVLVLLVQAIVEVLTHNRYSEFLQTADPRFGDSLDLALISKAVQENNLVGVKLGVASTQRVQDACHRFHKIVADALRGASR